MDGWQYPMYIHSIREAALTAAEVQHADAVLLQHIAQTLSRSEISARTRQAPVSALRNEVRLYGGRLQAETAGSKELINNFETGYNKVKQGSKYFEPLSFSHVFHL